MKNTVIATTLPCQTKAALGIFAFAITALAETAFGSGTNTWDNAVAPGGNTPATAYDWSNANNWNDTSYAPTAFGDGADLGSAATAPRFIRLPALGAFGLTYAQWANNNHLLGDFVFGDDPAGTFRGTSSVNANSIIYGDFYLNSLKAMPYVGAFAIAGYFRRTDENPLGRSQIRADWGRTGELTMRMDLFADSSNPVRNAPIQDSGTEYANAGFRFVGPRGAPAQSGTWSQTAESAYLNAVSMDGVVAPGSIVTGEGIPPGTFVKYVFSTTGWIELSEAATLTIAANTLSFGAITPSVVQYIPKHRSSNLNGSYVRAVKYREEDGCRLVYKEIQDNGTGAKHRRWGLTDDEVSAGYIPGDIVISNMTLLGSSTASNTLVNAVRLELPNVLAPHWQIAPNSKVRLTVPEGRTGGFSKFHGADGLIEKRGGGTLSLGFVEPVTAGTIKVDEGRLEVSEAAPAATGAIQLERLELAAGTTVKIPAGGMTVANLKASDGAKVEGPGTLTVTSSMIGVPGLVNGAVLRATTPNFASREYVFSGMTPWFDLDASDFGTDKMTTELENGTNFVTRWEDSCGGGHYAVQYLTNAQGGKCWIRENATNGMPFVDLGPFASTNNTAPGRMDAPNRALKICPPAEIDPSGKGYYEGLEASSWEGLKKPAIKAAFFAVSSENGGGSLLGAAGANYMQYGLIHGKGGADAPIICFEKSTWNSQWYVDYLKDSYIDNGTTVFRVNGRSVYPRSEPFSGGYDVITFCGSRESCLLGTFWQSGSKDYENSANGLAYGEVICFTNTITTAQMENIEIYLQNKWYGRRAPGCFYEGAVLLEDGSTLDVSAGSDGAVVATTLGGIGTVAGNVIFAENGVFRIDLDATGAPVTDIMVNGQLSLPARASVEFAGDVRKLKAGTYTLLSATTCVGSPSAWTFGAGSGGKSYKMRRTGNGLELAVIPRGINIIFR